jgi:hypothetical protein
MADGLHFAALTALIGKKQAARYGSRGVTIGAVGIKDGARFVMATDKFGGVILGEPDDFYVPARDRQALTDSLLRSK